MHPVFYDEATARVANVGSTLGTNVQLALTDPDSNEVEAVTGPFPLGSIWAAVTPCDENGAPASCPSKGYPPNYLGTLDPWTGHLTRSRSPGRRSGRGAWCSSAPGGW